MVDKYKHKDNHTTLSTAKAAKHFGVSANTIRNWDKAGTLQSFRTQAGQRRFILPNKVSTQKRQICYCRVSSRHQKDDLQQQVNYMSQKFPKYEIITDIGSGINWKRPGFKAILESSKSGNISDVVIAHRDRLCRFAFELVQDWLESSGVKLMVLDEGKFSPDQELADDLLSIVQVFVAKKNGKRRHNRDSASNPGANSEETPQQEKELFEKDKNNSGSKPTKSRKTRNKIPEI